GPARAGRGRGADRAESEREEEQPMKQETKRTDLFARRRAAGAFPGAGRRPRGRAEGRFPDSAAEERAERRAHDDPPAEMEPAGTHANEPGPAADDALGLYLQQMGSIPLLTREQEIDLTRRLERLRRRYRRAALWSWSALAHVVELFEQVQARELML